MPRARQGRPGRVTGRGVVHFRLACVHGARSQNTSAARPKPGAPSERLRERAFRLRFDSRRAFRPLELPRGEGICLHSVLPGNTSAARPKPGTPPLLK